jgi:hypothetical protein
VPPLTDVAVLIEVRVARDRQMESIVLVDDIHASRIVGAGFDQRIPALDPGSDGGVFGAIGDIALAGAAVSAWVLAARVRSARSVATVLAGLLTFLTAR